MTKPRKINLKYVNVNFSSLFASTPRSELSLFGYTPGGKQVEVVTEVSEHFLKNLAIQIRHKLRTLKQNRIQRDRDNLEIFDASKE